jgi:hypothetical protein
MRRDALRTMLFRAALASSLQFAFGDRMHRVQSYWWQRRIGSQMCPRDRSRKAAMACDHRWSRLCEIGRGGAIRRKLSLAPLCT